MIIKLSKRARTDLENIRRYTLEKWGQDQWITYFLQINRAFEQIIENPDGGKNRDLFHAGMRSVNCGRHVIFWKCLNIADDDPVVLRIVHQRQNMPALVYYDDLSGG